MRINPVKESERKVDGLMKATLIKVIGRVWNLNYNGTRSLMRQGRDDSVTIQVNHSSVAGLSLLLSKSHLEVIYKDESFHVDWYVDPRTGEQSDFLIGSNWQSNQTVFVLVIEAMIDHCIQIAQQS